jgi:hypothetical protein
MLEDWALPTEVLASEDGSSTELYDTPGAWRPIALLNTIGKLIEAIIVKRIQGVAERHRLFPSTQMGARRARSMETALELLTEQIHTVRMSANHVGSKRLLAHLVYTP